MINYSDPRFQQAMLALAAKDTGSNISKLTSNWVSQQMKDRLGQETYGLRKNMNEAQISRANALTALANERLGLDRNKLGLIEKEIVLANRNLASNEAGLGWRQKYARKYLDDQETAMNLGGLLGGATTLYTAYEANRRAKKDAALQEIQDQWMKGLQSRLQGVN